MRAERESRERALLLAAAPGKAVPPIQLHLFPPRGVAVELQFW